ncbi:MAG TPA: Xaa-Pro peptidase family protein [Anaerolineales bacterium]|nr:Xaa-Pro peptidase family protein [Anaerolineales bacterium]
MSGFMISENELQLRQHRLKIKLQELGMSAGIFFRPVRIQYLTGFSHLSTERPIALIVPVDGDPAILIPKLEEQHLQAQVPWLKNIRVYDEFPGRKHPLLLLGEWIMELGIKTAALGADNDGHLDQNGYDGPTLSKVFNTEIRWIGNHVDQLRMVKSEAEIDLLRVSGDWAARTHQFLQEAVREGRSERDISRNAEDLAIAQLDQESGEAGHWGSISLLASFHSGPRTAMSHAAMGNRPICLGDNLVTYCQGNILGYVTELERTMFFGEPTPKQQTVFRTVVEAQRIALEVMRPGMGCADVDRLVRQYLEDSGYVHAIQHHQGHGLGLEFHEGPFLDIGDATILEAGMVLSVEPGLYIPEIGGFRHSDTVAVTQDGIEILTPYPHDLDDLVIIPR